jgi:hypothetical protein
VLSFSNWENEMLNLTIGISGKGVNDLVIALEVITKQVRECYRCGFDRNETGHYSYTIDGQPEDHKEEDSE